MVSRRSLITAAGAGAVAAVGSPLWSRWASRAAAASPSLPVSLKNNSGSGTVYAYISGSDSTGWPGFVTSSGHFQRLPSPSSVLTEWCAWWSASSDRP